MRPFSYIIILLFLCAGMACMNNKKSSIAKDKADDRDFRTAAVIGVYQGELPCADCEAINTYLTLKRDQSFELRYMYQGKSTDEFVRIGKWEVEKNKLVLEGIDYQYKIDDDKLQQLDLSGNVITGELADNYLLTRIDDNL